MAADIPSGGVTLSEATAWLSGQGYAAEAITDSDKTQHLRFMLHDVKVGVYFFDCANSRCASIQFSSGWATHGKFDTAKMNTWNRDKRWCRGYFDSTNDPWVEYDVDLSPGGTYESLKDQLNVFESCVTNFKTMYGL